MHRVLSLAGVGIDVGGRRLLSNVSLRLQPGRRVALVGGNGIGKTTLLHVVVGQREPDEGSVSRPRDLRLGWLPQDVVDDVGASSTVLEHVLSGADHLLALEGRLRELEQKLEHAGADEQARVLETYADLQERYTTLGGYELEAEAHRVLDGLGFAPSDASRPTSELSGGWRVRVALAKLLLARPDVLVLDEPTNHLDLETIAWLEQTLVKLPGGLLFVSHDRDFIDAVADTIVEVAAGTAAEYDVRAGTVAAEEGGFAAFVAQREARLVQLRAARAQQDRQLAEIERFVERFRYKASKARQVQSRVKSLDKVERVEIPDHKHLVARFQFPAPPRSGRLVAELSDVAVSFGPTHVLSGVNLALERGRKIALVGPNGAGKTTLLRLLAGDLAPTSGTVERGHQVEVAVVDQHQAEVMNLDHTVLDEFRSALAPAHRGANVRSMVAAFGFPGDLAERLVGELSGGERTRLGLAKVMASPVNLLLLDEPTNHLDLASRDVLEDAIQAYPGTVVLITHDRHVIRAAADAIVEVNDGQARWFDGTYEELLEARRRAAHDVSRSGPASRRESAAADSQQRRGRQGVSPEVKKLRAKVRTVEQDLAAAEDEIATLTRQLADPAVYDDADKVAELVARHGVVKDRAASLYEAWEQAAGALEVAEARVDEAS
ncbi:MAG: ABC-F family ATP-binding cassette domain-containing protein [Nitriliruptoraceae bacterium]